MSKVNFPKWLVNDAIDSGFSAGLMRKDIRLVMELADRLDVDLDGFAPIAHIWLESSKGISDAADFNEITKYADKEVTQ